MSIKESIAKAPATRPKRTPIGLRGRLNVTDKDPNYEYRIVNVTNDRVEMFQEAGWEVVPAKANKVGDSRVEGNASEGSALSINVGLGDRAVLMRIQKEWYLEDQAAKQQIVNKSEEEIKQKARANGGTFARDNSA